MFNYHKATHIPQYHQDMLIDRVDMKQVMLHLSNNSSEDGQVTPKNAAAIHEVEGATDALGLL